MKKDKGKQSFPCLPLSAYLLVDEQSHLSDSKDLLVGSFDSTLDKVSGCNTLFEDLIGAAEVGPVLAQFRNLRAESGTAAVGL